MKFPNSRLLPFLLLPLIVCVWFWPASFGGRRPAGGSISAVDLPRMTYYQNALSEGRYPLWNEQVGFGIPILAEGQIGILYPVNLLLYQVLEAQDAYLAGMLVHFVLAGWFAFLCARGFRLGPAGSMLAAVVFIGQGFFVGHLEHQWSYQAGCWLPLAVWATWKWMETEDWGWLFGVILALAFQGLAGHFQLAFYTQVTVLTLALARVTIAASDQRMASLRRGLLLLGAPIVAAMLAAVQLVPTVEYLLQSDGRGRGFDYLASFSMPPLQLLNYIAPTLFQLHPLWEDVVFSAGETSRTACLVYIGLVPLGLAAWAVGGCRRQRETWMFLLLLCVSLSLSVGPALPGFGWLIKLPGFGWFAASARWSIVSGLFLGLLAGKGLESAGPELSGHWFRGYVAALAGLLVVTVLFLYGDRQTEAFQRYSRTSHSDLRLLLYGYRSADLSIKRITPTTELPRMLRDELWPPIMHFSLLVLASVVLFRRLNSRAFQVLLVAWTVIDLGLAHHILRAVDFEPRGHSSKDSQVLTEVARYAPHRIAGTLGSFPMLVGVSSLGRPGIGEMPTFWDLGPRAFGASPATVPPLTRWGDKTLMLGFRAAAIGDDEVVFCRLSNIRVVVLESDESITIPVGALERVRDVDDAWLTTQTYTSSSLKLNPQGRQWSFWEIGADIDVARAWLFPLDDPAEPGTDPRLFTRPPPARRQMLERAIAVHHVVDRGEFVEIRGSTDSPAVLVLSDLLYPGWKAELTQSDSAGEALIGPAFGDWRSVLIPESGDFCVTFRFQADSFRIGRRISLVSGGLWMLGFAAILIHRWLRRRGVVV